MSRITFFPPAKRWVNQDIALYHGTLLDAAHSIVDHVDSRFARERTDFGRGFYMTTFEVQAKRFAQDRSNSRQEEGAVVAIILGREELASLSTLAFVNGKSWAEDFWSFVQFCRAHSGHKRSLDRPYYDTVVGPVTKNWSTGRSLYRTFDQVSFHTEEAFACLNRAGRRRIIWTCTLSKTR